MKRKAILIESSNVSGLTDLPGARKDVENWRNFLTSELGGGWAHGDLVILRKPLSSDLKTELNVHDDCYCFVAFSGHGSEGSVALNDFYRNFRIEELKPKTAKGTLIIDSCRGVEEAAESAIKAANAVGTINEQVVANLRRGQTMIFNSANIGQMQHFSASSYSYYWEEALNKASKGIAQMYSCAKGQSAHENPNAGGMYTSLLMQSADQFSRTREEGSVQTTKDAHDYAARMLPPQQTPEYSPSGIRFPFAVSL